MNNRAFITPDRESLEKVVSVELLTHQTAVLPRAAHNLIRVLQNNR